jgi:hypothetical protein
MKHIIAFCLFVLTTLPAFAAPAEMNLSLSYWVEGAEDAQTALNLETNEGGVWRETVGPDGAQTLPELALTPELAALIEAAIRATHATLSFEYGEDFTGPLLAVEWSVMTANGFARGNMLVRYDDQPEAIIAIQDKVFGQRLRPLP